MAKKKKYMCIYCHYLWDEEDVTFDEMGMPMLRWGRETCCGGSLPPDVELVEVEVDAD
jgi:hypothetical protein